MYITRRRFIVKPPQFIKKILFNLTWSIPSNQKTLYLTFDDGPIPETTPWILQTLKDYNAKATFFCVGDNVFKHPELFAQIKAEGHAVGNHTYNHLNGWKTPVDEYLRNIEIADQYIHSNLMRPPYGMLRRPQRERLHRKYNLIMWDVLSRDYDITVSPEECLNNVIHHAEQGSIIVFHDNIKATRNLNYALPRVLSYFSLRGFSFEIIDSEKLNSIQQWKWRSNSFKKQLFIQL